MTYRARPWSILLAHGLWLAHDLSGSPMTYLRSDERANQMRARSRTAAHLVHHVPCSPLLTCMLCVCVHTVCSHLLLVLFTATCSQVGRHVKALSGELLRALEGKARADIIA